MAIAEMATIFFRHISWNVLNFVFGIRNNLLKYLIAVVHPANKRTYVAVSRDGAEAGRVVVWPRGYTMKLLI